MLPTLSTSYEKPFKTSGTFVMNEKFLYWSSVMLGLAALVFLVTDIALFSGNRSLQTKISDRQTEIGRGTGLSQVNQALVQLLADASVKNNDAEIRTLLADQGITVKPTAVAKAADDKDATLKDSKKK